jgi:uncharacterized peroxidase-related enzyme
MACTGTKVRATHESPTRDRLKGGAQYMGRAEGTSKFPSLGEGAAVPDILRLSPAAGRPLLELHEAVMRGPSALTPGQRELIATYVSGLNGCRYCHGVHAETTKAYAEVPAAAVDRLMTDLELAGFDVRLRPILRYARKLTLEPAGVTAADATAVYEAGWDEQALHDAILVTCLFNFMNRLLEGHGIHGDEDLYKRRGPMLREHGYLPLIRRLQP